jgi:hypothetical protein
MTSHVRIQIDSSAKAISKRHPSAAFLSVAENLPRTRPRRHIFAADTQNWQRLHSLLLRPEHNRPARLAGDRFEMGTNCVAAPQRGVTVRQR